MVGGLRLISRTGMVMTKIERHMVMTKIERHMSRPWGKRELVRVNDDQGWCLMVMMMIAMASKMEKCESDNTWEEERTDQG